MAAVVRGGQHDQRHAVGQQFLQAVQTIGPGHAGHGQVQQNDIHVLFALNSCDRLIEITGLDNNGRPFELTENMPQSIAEKFVVVGDQDLHLVPTVSTPACNTISLGLFGPNEGYVPDSKRHHSLFDCKAPTGKIHTR
ncbi:hypothetical protein MCP1_240061 [Candidatus Terasakiella magnetica]|nr:hypothetical protein MCP1_240061 [Candidatus Terasakiella magnetica]